MSVRLRKRGRWFLRWFSSRSRSICSCSYNGSTPAVPSCGDGKLVEQIFFFLFSIDNLVFFYLPSGKAGGTEKMQLSAWTLIHYPILYSHIRPYWSNPSCPGRAMNGRPNGIGGRAEGSGGRYGWLQCTCQLDLLCMCATTHASETKKKGAYLEPTPPGPAKSINIGYINTCLFFVFIIPPLSLVRSYCMPHCVLLHPHARPFHPMYAHLRRYIPGPMCAPLPS